MALTKRLWTIIAGLGTLAALAAAMLAVSGAPEARADEPAETEAETKTKTNDQAEADPALERARAQAQMLDALYKNAVVSITERYQRGQPAIMVAKDVFAAMEDGGYHSVRLVDVTGIPMNEENLPKSDFEKKAAEKILDGEPYYEEIEGSGDDRTLLVATVVPAVHERCASCHAVAKGDLLGFLRYQLPVE